MAKVSAAAAASNEPMKKTDGITVPSKEHDEFVKTIEELLDCASFSLAIAFGAMVSPEFYSLDAAKRMIGPTEERLLETRQKLRKLYWAPVTKVRPREVAVAAVKD